MKQRIKSAKSNTQKFHIKNLKNGKSPIKIVFAAMLVGIAAGIPLSAFAETSSGPQFSLTSEVPVYKKAGDQVTISFTASEEPSDYPIVKINDEEAAYTSGDWESGYDYTYTIQSSDTEGYASIEISAEDLLGNAGVTSYNSALLIDLTAPTAGTAAVSQQYTSSTPIEVSYSGCFGFNRQRP